MLVVVGGGGLVVVVDVEVVLVDDVGELDPDVEEVVEPPEGGAATTTVPGLVVEVVLDVVLELEVVVEEVLLVVEDEGPLATAPIGELVGVDEVTGGSGGTDSRRWASRFSSFWIWISAVWRSSWRTGSLAGRATAWSWA